MDELPGTRHSLIVKLRDPANSAEWGEFVAIYEPLVYRLARRKGLQDADAGPLGSFGSGRARPLDPHDTFVPGSHRSRNLLINFSRAAASATRQWRQQYAGIVEAQRQRPSATALLKPRSPTVSLGGWGPRRVAAATRRASG